MKEVRVENEERHRTGKLHLKDITSQPFTSIRNILTTAIQARVHSRKQLVLLFRNESKCYKGNMAEVYLPVPDTLRASISHSGLLVLFAELLPHW